MQKTLAIGFITSLALASLLSLAEARVRDTETGWTDPAGVLLGSEILTTLRTIGFDPIDAPVRRGPYYVLHAYAPSGVEMRVVADAQFGDVLSIEPAGLRSTWYDIYAPRYHRAPRIIHVP